MKADCRSRALEFADRGMSVIPLQPGGKKPLLESWAEYQQRIPTIDEIHEWFDKWPEANLGLVTGQISGIAAYDIDSEAGIQWAKSNLPKTSVYQETGKGYHSFFKTNGSPVANKVRVADGVDVRGDGGYVVIAPSIHPSGKQYKLIFPEGFDGWDDLTPFPALAGKKEQKSAPLEPVERGQRNDTIAKIAGKYARKGFSLEEILLLCRGYNSSLREPLPDSEVETIVNSIWKRHQEDTPKKSCLTFTPASELTAFQEPTSWLVKRYLEEGSLSCLFAPPESLKTFLVLDMGLCIATGAEWHGQKVKPGPVLYICGEARRNIGRRLTGWERERGRKADGFFVSSSSAALLDPIGLVELEAAADEVCKHGKPALIIIDTLNRNFGPGDENSTTDMTKFIATLDRLRDRLQCAILIVHHTGLADAGRGRGNSALRGALDFEFCINQKPGATIEEAIIELSCSKCKDHDRPPTMAFKPVVVDLGLVDEDLQPITSLVLERTEYTPPQQKEKRLPPQQRIALEALREATRDSYPAHLEAWREAAYRKGIADSQDAKRKAFNRARTALVVSGLVEAENDLYSIPGQSGTLAGHVPECHGDLAGQAGHTPLGVSRMSRSRSGETVTVKL